MAPVFTPFLAPFLVCLLGLILDQLLGEPRRLHPLAGFGNLASVLERLLNSAPRNAWRSLILGALALCALVLPLLFLAIWLSAVLTGFWLLLAQAAALYFALSLRGLAEHGLAVAQPLQRGELDAARGQVSRIVSRQASALDEQGVAAAATESMLENGADAVFASLFWFLVGGIPGVIVHRAVNTLDAMWGYRNPQFLYFGRAAARLDDVMGWVPARLTALTYTLLGNRKLAWYCWRRQAPQWDSPNAGPVMAAGAGALNVQLGGPSPYAQGVKQRPYLGGTSPASANSIQAAIALVRHGTWLWLAVIFAITGLVVAVAGS
ncbi:adenosylcobinamide-phosphate synthase CbiB [Marinobacter sp. M3C]|jgi:adenosylcobinamide-phosphate synthase|uniref:adenosylcobinamide-phosphate synthase CbiB n=1 Tax=unclassified Marinobacter TaxID=83889 RepID=UPI002010C232|nr:MULTISPECIES: adenosylcobinamide-phosphate synthase CbiB [unclassified Marinobacter]MCL1477990.1 adenosylcobinamide-phosphate synthase CbiB [Marinobacter sp.]MCL1480445.1 adenosylcobinamide-phosphate synthase CbiB [Marinobacter sp.]MCL1484625.1 adenosylcobinamide-phosphate synthase CbiB [Marinobacter sp.]MCL1487760.1 adenosylcobinamide-phosphate synthase CbiB [Marinobacter sp.]UQG56349.1 adenosylcobinamide-phosphate synthase CbiB [Marinobacter sp. M4C]